MKRWWLPTRKGDDFTPRTSVKPPKLVVNGSDADASKLARSLVEPYNALVKAFHGRCQQDYSLSQNPQYKRHIEWEGARATYMNLDGQEIITVQVDQSQGGEEKPVPKDYWDYALVELYLPDAYQDDGAAELFCLAHISMPNKEIEPTAVWPVEGVASNWLNRDDPDPVINGATSDLSNRVELTTGPEAVASFTVDLRLLRGLSAVAVDLHPYMYYSESLPIASYWQSVPFSPGDPNNQPPAGYTEGPIDNSGNIETFNSAGWALIGANLTAGHTGYMDYGWPTFTVPFDDDPTQTAVIAELPSIYFDFADELWKFNATHDKYYTRFAATSLQNGPGGAIIPGTWYDYWEIRTSIDGGLNIYEGPDMIPAEVQVTMFKGVPDLDVTEYDWDPDAFPSYYRFTYPALFPNRAGHMTPAPNELVPAYKNETFPNPGTASLISEMYGIPKLGTLTIPLEIPKGPSWQSA